MSSWRSFVIFAKPGRNRQYIEANSRNERSSFLVFEAIDSFIYSIFQSLPCTLRLPSIWPNSPTFRCMKDHFLIQRHFIDGVDRSKLEALLEWHCWRSNIFEGASNSFQILNKESSYFFRLSCFHVDQHLVQQLFFICRVIAPVYIVLDQ